MGANNFGILEGGVRKALRSGHLLTRSSFELGEAENARGVKASAAIAVCPLCGGHVYVIANGATTYETSWPQHCQTDTRRGRH